MDNKTMIQYFEWNLPPDGVFWERVARQAKNLKDIGIDIIWLPPAYKGASGVYDVGYGVYDLYDLGEFSQKGTIGTKYGTKDEYINAINSLHEANISVFADIVLNHKMGADEKELVEAEKFDPNNRNNQISGESQIEAWTKFTFPGRNGKYSDFIWDWKCFTGVDWDDKLDEKAIFQFEGKEWSEDVDEEKGNYDYLMGADVDMSNPDVVSELIKWGKWYLDITKCDGFRLDAVKHIDYSFYENWLDEMRKYTGKSLFSVGEYWHADTGALLAYLENSGDRMSLFDVPLHMNFFNASNAGGNFDMGGIFNNTLVSADPVRSVTFVDNHDSQPGQSLETWVESWFKPIAYALILLRKDGLPCVFYADLYGLRDDGVPSVSGLKRMLYTRRRYAYGNQNDYFDHNSVVGFTREGDEEHENSACAVIMSDSDGGEKKMYVGKKYSGRIMRDVTRRNQKIVKIDEDGNGNFSVKGGSVSVYVFDEAYRDIVINCD